MIGFVSGREMGGSFSWTTYVLLVVVDQACVLEVGVEFDLVDGGWRGRRLEDPIEVFGQVVRDADGASEAGGFELFHLLPLGLVLFFLLAEERSVDQVPERKNSQARRIIAMERA